MMSRSVVLTKYWQRSSEKFLRLAETPRVSVADKAAAVALVWANKRAVA